VAPNPTKVMLYIAEKIAGGAALEIEQVTVKLMRGEQHAPAHHARTPFDSLPVLEIGPGDFIIESLTIMDYLEDQYPAPSMIGTTARQRARCRELERIADVRVLTPIARCVHATNSPLGLPPSADIAASSRASFSAGLAYFDDVLRDGRAFITGDTVAMADCTLAAALQFARFGELEMDTALDNLERWDRAYRERVPAQTVLLR
jgi:glutathione S-transferase